MKKYNLFIFTVVALLAGVMPLSGRAKAESVDEAEVPVAQVPADFSARLQVLAGNYASEPLANRDGSAGRPRLSAADAERYQALQVRAYEVLAPLAAAVEAGTAPAFSAADLQNLAKIFAGQFRADPGPEAGDLFGEIYKQNKTRFSAELRRLAKSPREASAMERYLEQYLESVSKGNG